MNEINKLLDGLDELDNLLDIVDDELDNDDRLVTKYLNDLDKLLKGK
jgi:hypothetical protein